MLIFKLGPLVSLWLVIVGCAVPMLALEKGDESEGQPNRWLLWTLKVFFIPFYAYGLFYSLTLLSYAHGLLALVVAVYLVDITFALVGYLFASRRNFYSVQPLGLGWFVCLICYGPLLRLWPQIASVSANEGMWPRELPHAFLAIPMLALLALYFSATIVFGIRFANLGYRGVITAGPYRLMKHPAYFCHAAFAWMTTIFFLPMTLTSFAAAMLITIIYRLRSTTEERHLREYPEYVAYCDWIAQHGIVARLKTGVLKSLRLAPGQALVATTPARAAAASSPTGSGSPR